VASLPNGTYGAAALLAQNGQIYLFGGNAASGVDSDLSTQAIRFDPKTNAIYQLAPLPASVFQGVAIRQWDYIYVFGRSSTTTPGPIIQFDPVSETSQVIGELPGKLGSVAAMHDRAHERAFLFAGSADQFPLMHFELDSETLTTLVQNSLPELQGKPAVVYDGKYGYIIGGYGIDREDDGTMFPSGGILR
jgi:hypothetical protein